jgi:hypothetical protein
MYCNNQPSFDHLLGGGEQRRHREAERATSREW